MICFVYLVCFVYSVCSVYLVRSVSTRPTGLGSAWAERASLRSKSWKIKAPPPSRSEKRRHPVITYG